MTDSYNQKDINLGGSNSIFLDVKNFGAVGDGIHDDTAAVQAAFDEAGRQGGGTVFFPSGVYKLTRQIDLPLTVSILGDGDSSVLDFSQGVLPDFPVACIVGTGSLIPIPTLATNIDQYDTGATLSTPSTIIDENDVIILENTTDFSFSLQLPYFHAGEFYRLVSVSGATLTFDNPSFGSYVVGPNILLWKLAPTNISIRRIRVIGIGTTTDPIRQVINIDLGRNIIIEDVTLHGSDFALIGIYRCYDTILTSIRGYDFSPAIGYNYGVNVANSQKFIMSDCQITVRRHAVAFGGGSFEGAVPSRLILVADSLLGSLEIYGFDNHGNCEFIEVSDCELYGGCHIGGDNIKISDCVIWAETNFGTCLSITALIGPNISIIDNEFIATADVSASPPGLIYYDDAALNPAIMTRSGTMRFIGNEIVMGDYSGQALAIHNRVLQQNIDFEGIDNEIIQNTSALSVQSTFQIRGNTATNSVWRNVVLRGNKSIGVGLHVAESGAKSVVIQNNFVYGAFAGNIVSDSAGPLNPWPSQDVLVSDNYSDFAGQNGIRIIGEMGVTNIAVRGNTATRSGQLGVGDSDTRSSLMIQGANFVICEDNVIGDNQGVPVQVRLWHFGNINFLLDYNNLNIGSVIAVNEINITKRAAFVFSSTNNSVSYGTAPPVAGSWLQGDIRWNTTPVAGGIPGWMCTASGTPGTWNAMAALAS